MSVPSLLSIFGNSGGEDPVYVDDVFRTTLYKGTGSTQTIATGLDNTTKSLLWIKDRDLSYPHYIYDTIRGSNKFIHTSSSQNEQTDASGPGGSAVIMKGFTNNGFIVEDNQINRSGHDICSWNFLVAPGFMDVVTFTGNGATSGSPLTVNHELGSAPGMIWVKNLTLSGDDYNSWYVYHRSLGVTKFMNLNKTNSVSNYSSGYGGWSNITSSSFQVFDGNAVNGSSYVAYLFAHDDAQFGTGGDESIIKCDSYGVSSNPQEVNLGFEPQWVMIKNTGTSSAYAPWIMFDNMRGVNAGDTPSSSYGHDPALSANYSYEEGTTYNYNANFIDFTPTGFKVFQSNTPVATSGGNFIYMAIRRPNKPPTAATEVFAIDNQATGTKPPQYHSNFVVDMALEVAFNEDPTYRNRRLYSRLQGNRYLKANLAGGQYNTNYNMFTWMDGFGDNNSSASTSYAWMFKRAPSFMDVVTYSGTGVTRTVNHNLTVKPELMIFKIRSQSFNWVTYDKVNGATNYMSLNSDNGTIVSSSIFNNTEPTSSVFTVAGASGNVNYSGGTHVAYLFATLPGISKVGSYTGTGNAINVDCGFTNGARFILIKRTNINTTGDWYVWDSVRGIVSGNDPYFIINSNAGDVTGTDYIDPLSTGFTVTSSAPAALNTSGGTYIFLAIA
jgi:hypothetical protein